MESNHKQDPVQRWKSRLAVSGVLIDIREVEETGHIFNNRKRYIIDRIDSVSLGLGDNRLLLNIPKFDDIAIGVDNSVFENILKHESKLNIDLDLTNLDYSWVISDDLDYSICSIQGIMNAIQAIYSQAILNVSTYIKFDLTQLTLIISYFIDKLKEQDSNTLKNPKYTDQVLRLVRSRLMLSLYNQAYEQFVKLRKEKLDICHFGFRNKLLAKTLGNNKILHSLYIGYSDTCDIYHNSINKLKDKELTEEYTEKLIKDLQVYINKLLNKACETQVCCNMQSGEIRLDEEKLKEHKELLKDFTKYIKSIK